MNKVCRRKRMKNRIAGLADDIISGYRLKRGHDMSLLLHAPLSEMQEGAYRIQKHFFGNHIDLCTIINGRSGRCGENCRYCAQSACHSTGIEEYDFLPGEEILKNAKANQEAGVNRFSVVTSGRAFGGKDFDRALEIYREMRRTLSIELCASHGLLTREQFRKLREAGVKSYHHNIETSRRFFPEICTSHTYEDRIQTIHAAQAEGLEVCSGGILGMGENWEDRLDMAVSLAELEIRSIPLNALTPIPGTGLENRPVMEAEEFLRAIALFRFINPEAHIRLAAGRKLLPQNGAGAFQAGASASITGNMLTTSGTTIREDLEMLQRLGMNNRQL